MTSQRMTRIALALALALGTGGATMAHDSQLAQAAGTGRNPQGMGPGMMGGQAMGPGMGQSQRMGPGQGMGPGMMGGQPMGPGMMGYGMNPVMMDSHVEGRIAFLHAELKITPAQTKLWDAYADTLRASAKDMTGMQGTMTTMMTATALPERLDAAERMMAERLDALKKIKTATLPLYAAFSAEQKATADQLMPAMGMGGMSGGMMGGGMGWGGMGWGGMGWGGAGWGGMMGGGMGRGGPGQ